MIASAGSTGSAVGATDAGADGDAAGEPAALAVAAAVPVAAGPLGDGEQARRQEQGQRSLELHRVSPPRVGA
jgi:hypothetical protein